MSLGAFFSSLLFPRGCKRDRRLETIKKAEDQLAATEEAWTPVIVRIEEEARGNPTLAKALQDARRAHDRAAP